MAFVPACGDCRPCRQGRAALCEPGAAANTAGTLLSGARRLRDPAPAVSCITISASRAFADHAVVAPESAIPIPDDLPFELAALFGCAVLTGVGAVINAAHLSPEDSVAVFGLGGVGMSAVLGARLASAKTIVVVDPVASKLDLAQRIAEVSPWPRATTWSTASE